MPRRTWRRTLDEASLARLRQPRDDIVGEQVAHDDGTTTVLVQADGPFVRYERRVEVVEADAEDPSANGRDPTHPLVEETFDFELAPGTWKFLTHRAVSRTLRRPPKPGKMPWWAPSQRPDARAATVLGLLATLSLTTGYLGTLFGRTMTFAADEFEISKTAQTVALSGARVGAVLAVVLGLLADRRGRRELLLVSLLTCIASTALGAATPNVLGLAATQAVNRGALAAAGILLGIIVAEEMPAGSRAYAVSLLSMTTALGAGVALWIMPIADQGLRAWRLLYLVPLLMIPAVLHYVRLVPETRRFARPHQSLRIRSHIGRLWPLAAAMFLLNIFTGPFPQIQNDFLREERDFNAGDVSLFVMATSTPGGLGILVGGRLAESIGRRAVAAVSVVISTALLAGSFVIGGPSMWVLALAGTVVGGAIVPSVLVYWPELFPTSLRGQTNGIVSSMAMAGSVVGLLASGLLADRFDSWAAAMPVIAIGPALMVVLILTRFPETAHRELEDINPVDRVEVATGAEVPTAGDPTLSTRNPDTAEG